MTRQEPEAVVPECQLCGGETIVFVDHDGGPATFDLCRECNRAFADLARQVAAR